MALRSIVTQHFEEAAFRHAVRYALTGGPSATLPDLARWDERLAAHLDGLAVAGEDAWPLCLAALNRPSPGVVFVAAVRAVEARSSERLDAVLDTTGSSPRARQELILACGWLERDQVQRVAARLLGSPDPSRRMAGVPVCAAHGIDSPIVAGLGIKDSHPAVQARVLRAAGELGLRDAASACAAAISGKDPECQFWAAWSAVLLGDRNRGLDTLTDAGITSGAHRARAFRLALQAMDIDDGHSVLQDLAVDPQHLRWLIQGAGIAGNPRYVSWIIGHMTSDRTARAAGEAFGLITGADLARLGLARKPPETFESGPSDDPNDPDVDMDPDDGLPWPDPSRVDQWWQAQSSRFPKGIRYFMGAPITREHCIDVLRNGYQRQRILAAHYLCLLEPGTPLFNTSAPAWRQQRLLAKMT
jgi:uncharacterized protein (TIGR02270 family)